MSIFLKLKKTNNPSPVVFYLFCSSLVGEDINRESKASFCVQMQRTPRMSDHAYFKEFSLVSAIPVLDYFSDFSGK